jgi:SAUR family protein
MAILRSRKQGGAKAITSATWHACATGGDTGKVPKGYVPMILVDREDDEHGQRILVRRDGNGYPKPEYPMGITR